MATPTDEHNPGADGDLNNLPKGEREETQQILDELGGENGADKPADAGDGKPKPGEEEKPKGDAEKPGEENVDGKPKPGEEQKPPRREVKLMPAWLHERQKADWDKREKELLDQIAVATGGKAPDTNDKGKDVPILDADATPAEIEAEATALAEKHGITKELAADLLTAAIKRSGKLPNEVVEGLKQIHNLTDQKTIEVEEAIFSTDFDAQIVPLIKAEYGDDVPPETIADIKEKLKGIAYTPEYAKVPYNTIYKGQDEFRGIIPPKKKGAEGSRGGSNAAGDNGTGTSGKTADTPLGKPWEEYNDDEIKGLSPEDFDKYSDHMAVAERRKGKR